MSHRLDIKVFSAQVAPPTTNLTAYLSTSFDSTSKIISASFYNRRLGGCGEGEIICTSELSGEQEISVGNLVQVLLTTEVNGISINKYAAIYLGSIEEIEIDYDDSTMTLRTLGLFNLFSTALVTTYVEDTDVAEVVEDIFTGIIAGKTWCQTAATGISIASSASLGDVEFEFTAADEVIKTFANIQGNIEYGVDATGLFYFRDAVTTRLKQLQVGLNVSNLKKYINGNNIINNYFVRCNSAVTSGALIRNGKDTTSVTNYRERSLVATAPEFKDAAKITAWISNKLSQTDSPITSYSFDALIFNSAVFWPSGKILLVNSVGATLQDSFIDSIAYKINADGIAFEITIGEADASYNSSSDIIALSRAVAFIEAQQVSENRIAHTGYEEFAQYVSADALARGLYNFIFTEFEEDAV